MYDIRTDLAAERHQINTEKGLDDGIIFSEEILNGIKITKAEVIDREAEERFGCKQGVYYTVETGKLWLKSGEERTAASKAIASILKRLLPKADKAPVLVAGLGNEQVTADAVGPKTAGGLVVTHHMKELNKPLYKALGVGDLAVICPMVLGQTGFESAVLVKCAVEKLKPCAVIAVDALAARSTERLGTTVQISSAGIAPGSGVDNKRAELSENTLGCPVISLGVPTVVDARTLAAELMPEGVEAKEDFTNFFVTPKEADVMIRTVSKLLAKAINAAVHSDIDDAEEYAPL